jgi:hypothetical protein
MTAAWPASQAAAAINISSCRRSSAASSLAIVRSEMLAREVFREFRIDRVQTPDSVSCFCRGAFKRPAWKQRGCLRAGIGRVCHLPERTGFERCEIILAPTCLHQ